MLWTWHFSIFAAVWKQMLHFFHNKYGRKFKESSISIDYFMCFTHIWSITWVKVENIWSFRLPLKISSQNVRYNWRYLKFCNTQLWNNEILHNFLEMFICILLICILYLSTMSTKFMKRYSLWVGWEDPAWPPFHAFDKIMFVPSLNFHHWFVCTGSYT